MRPILYIALAGSFALGACSSTYKTAQTPDDVYYSPRQQQRTYASNNGSNGNSQQDENARYTQSADEDGGTYVTYNDDQGDYQRRLNRFGSTSNSYTGGYMDGYSAASNLYMGGYGYGFSPYSSFGYNSLWGPSLSLGFGWGSGFYSPWSYGGYGGGWGYPYYGSYWPYGGGYYGHYYPVYAGGYYGGGYYGHGGGYYYSRPSNSYGPVRSGNERIIRASNYTNSGGNGGNAGGGGYYRPARGSVAPINNGGNSGGYAPSNTDRPRRIFQQSNSERPVISRPSYDNNSGGGYNNNNGGGGYSRPSRSEYRPAPSPSPSYSAPSGGGRVGGGSSGGGGGYSRPARGGR
ncbi:hypothetical protein [Chitinophaga flava]|uniref:Uncharacterized protein n=1 Tax=Chitinophaga flava TaxID=2259036 RepID=A0A365XZW4_9BACT|nr:hypothetical protein [Chitinophaga flava]RBL91916.1 hypothetical protein DF182_04760 [Chitinophaga flava]